MVGMQNYHVSAGNFFVGPKKPMTLQAFLGTCVGVTLYDHSANIGGLIHILLPEPINPESTHDRRRYAVTGMPEFIEAMIEAGASKHNLKAVIAGGALVGPLSEQDLALNIGGRTVEVVQKILDAENIPVEYSETGGFFTCVLNLNLQDGSHNVDPSGMELYKPDAPVVTPEPHEIEKAAANIQPIPQVALKVLRIIDEQTYDIDLISSEVHKDQVIMARTLQICNSALFAKKRKIETLDHALVYLGQELFVKYVISAAVKNYFHPTTQGYSLCQGGLYHHAVGTAVIAEKIALFTGKVRPSLAYTAGLLHDIGKVVLDQYIADAYPLFYRKYNDSNENFTGIEKEVFGHDHTEIGTLLARQWSLPESLQEVIEYHHRPYKAPTNRTLSNVVFLADLLMSRFSTGLELERLDVELMAATMNGVGLKNDRFTEVVDLIPDQVFSDSPEMAIEAA